MKTEIDIESLVQNFNRGRSTRAELKTLIAYFREHEPGSEFLSMYLKAWETSTSETNTLNSAEEYSMIIDRINKNTLYLRAEEKYLFVHF